MSAPRHRPVLLAEVLKLLAPRDGGIYVDGTFGAGGYSRAILESADCRVVGLDRDPRAIAEGAPLADSFAGRLTLVEGRFGEMVDLLAAKGVDAADGVALDLGVSSMQLDEDERAFSFRGDGPLDMRMGREGASAADLVNSLPEAELARVFAALGEERRARAVARAIVGARNVKPIRRTGELAEIVRAVVRATPGGIDPATRSFQALRILVNDELQELARGLLAAERLLAPGGRLAVVAFHSLEDRLVKTFLAARGKTAAPSRHRPQAAAPAPTFRILTKKPVEPTVAETAGNPRARSAKLRAAERTQAPAPADDPLAALLSRLPALDSIRRRR